jgi:hypothetical protein
LLGIAAAANGKATFRAVTSQPNWPAVDHTTPWVSLVPHMSGGAVSAGPSRALAILAACGCAIIVRHRWPGARHASAWSPELFQDLLWWVAAALAIRCAFEPVMVAYYVWPALGVALVAASSRWSRLIPTSLAAVILTFVSGAGWRGPWIWWGSMVTGLGLILMAARISQRHRVSQATRSAWRFGCGSRDAVRRSG